MSSQTNLPIRTVKPGLITVSAFTGFEPFVFSRDAELVGFDVDILSAFGRRHGLRVVFIPTNHFDQIWLHPAAGQVDLAAAGIARFEERISSEIAWTDPYLEVSRSILISKSQAGELRSIGDFDNRSIAFVQSSTADLDTRRRAPEGAKLVPIEHQQIGMQLLRSGEIDGLAMGAPSNMFNSLTHPEFCVIDVHDLSPPEGLRFTLNVANEQLLSALNHFIDDAKSTGEIQAYFEKWMTNCL